MPNPVPILGRTPSVTAKLRIDGSLELHVDPEWPAIMLFALGQLINRQANALLDQAEFQQAMAMDMAKEPD